MATPHDKKPEIGDLIEIVRGSFQHWAVYVGDGFIVHLTSDPEVACSNSMSSVPNNKALVTKRELRDVVGTDEWKINNILDGKHEPHSKEDIVRDARAMVGEAPYNIFFGNCEHFATFIRYGKPESRQVRKKVEVATLWTLLVMFLSAVAAYLFGADTGTESKPRRKPRNSSTNR